MWGLLLGGMAVLCGGQSVLALPTDAAAVALAAPGSQIRWRPNPDRGSASSTLSGGRRGTQLASCANHGANLALLVPNNAEGLTTTLAEPTVAWHVETEQPVSLELVLSHPDQATPVYSKTLNVTQTETVQVTLPELELETRYRWTVFLTCDDRATAEVSDRSFIRRIDEVPAQLTTAQSEIDQAKVYAAAGIWYDACRLLLEPAQAQQPEAQQMLHQLLAQANPAHPLVDSE